MGKDGLWKRREILKQLAVASAAIVAPGAAEAAHGAAFEPRGAPGFDRDLAEVAVDDWPGDEGALVAEGTGGGVIVDGALVARIVAHGGNDCYRIWLHEFFLWAARSVAGQARV